MKVLKRLIKIVLVISGTFSSLMFIEERVKKPTNIHRPYGIYEQYIKRPLDVFLATGTLIVLSPVMLLMAIIVRFKLGSPIFFVQERPGCDGKLFRIFKFRTMSEDRDKNGELLPDIERLPKLGEVLRATSLDELPELFNIIKGDMAVVGPRPLLPRYLPYFTEKERHRHDIRPGLTGPAQVSGRNMLSWEERFELDVDYVNRVTFLQDIVIIIKTIKQVIKKENVVIRGTENSVLDFDVERRLKRESENVRVQA